MVWRGAVTRGPVDGAPDSRWQRDEDDVGAFSSYAQHPMAVFFAKVGDVRASGFEDPQAPGGPAWPTRQSRTGSPISPAAVRMASNYR